MNAAPQNLRLHPGDALIIVDVQNDFLPGGALAVPRGDEVIPVLNEYISIFKDHNLPIIATRDWHPPNHCSFTEHGGIWPTHCIAESHGAAFASGLELPRDALLISKGTAFRSEAYSGFEQTHLADMLKEMKVCRVFVGGLATDYCVLNTVKDALQHSFEAYFLADASRAVDVNTGDGENAEREMNALGAQSVELIDPK
ncbi:MAG: isochorismatase family protein [Verrucomicrobia bacterium]|nr:isochorismatase family protein [Verrucomicrobiota bacterium]